MNLSTGIFVRLTAQDKANIADLGKLWGCGKSEAVRRAVGEALVLVRSGPRAGLGLAAGLTEAAIREANE